MNRESFHRILIIVEMVLLALPVSLFCLFFGLALMATMGFPWGVEELAIMHFVLVGTLGIVGLWCVTLSYLTQRRQPIWWWRAACMGAGLVGVSLGLFCLLALGWNPPEWVKIIALGIFATPLLVPFLHFAYLRQTTHSS
jgi:hypothetical protein